MTINLQKTTLAGYRRAFIVHVGTEAVGVVAKPASDPTAPYFARSGGYDGRAARIEGSSYCLATAARMATGLPMLQKGK